MLQHHPLQTNYVEAYRSLYRALLHAVQYAKPARYQGRDILRNAFRKGDPATYDQKRIENTIMFLNIAAKEKGLEHKLLKNLLHGLLVDIICTESSCRNRNELTPTQQSLRKHRMTHYDKTVAMLNESMGLCLR
ncbi:Mitochondrial carrier protein [Rutstroemia sp. NJR-2017a BVV2]|nr:Mitochondrial carrier protein [Rutstroemia sp. NJR-2017a BVV2]